MVPVVLMTFVLVAACGGGGETGQGADGLQGDEVTGTILEVDSRSIDDIRSFTLRSEGETHEIFIAEDVDYGFPLSHLGEHKLSGDPVKVEIEHRGNKPYASSIEDV